MKKFLVVFIVFVMVLLMIPAITYAVPNNATYLEWTTRGEQKTGYFMKTGSGIVQAWIYNHPDLGDIRIIYKPVDKFKNAATAGCDGDCIKQNIDWKAINLRNAMDTLTYKLAFDELFLFDTYVMCIYQM